MQLLTINVQTPENVLLFYIRYDYKYYVIYILIAWECKFKPKTVLTLTASKYGLPTYGVKEVTFMVKKQQRFILTHSLLL